MRPVRRTRPRRPHHPDSIRMRTTHRLIDAISSAIATGAADDPIRLRSLANSYTDACARAESRLAQCEEMLSRGEALQAIQLAEADPPLLDEIAALEFFGADAWRTTCRDAGLPTGEVRNQRAIHLLNEAYARGITASSPLYRDYRAAIASRDDRRALDVLELIARLNPNDPNAPNEAERLRRKIRESLAASLPALLTAGDEAAILDAVETIGRLGGPADIPAAHWDDASRIAVRLKAASARRRCAENLGRIQVARDGQDHARALALADAIRSDCAEHAIQLDPDDAKRVDAIETWASGVDAAERRRAAADRLDARIQNAAEEAENFLAEGKLADPDAIRATSGQLSKLWLDLERTGIPPAKETAEIFHRARGKLRAAEHKEGRATAIKISAAAAASVVAIALVATPIWLNSRARSAIAEIKQLESERRSETASRKIERWERSASRLADNPRLRNTIDLAKQWIDAERAKARAAAALAADLEGSLASQLTATHLPDALRKLEELRSLLPGLCDELRPELAARVATIGNGLESRRAALAGELGDKLKGPAAEILALGDETLGLAGPIDPKRHAIHAFEAIEGTIALWKAAGGSGDPAQSAIATSVERLASRVIPLREELERYDRALSGARAATDLDAYLNALRPAAFTKLSGAPATIGAREVIGKSHLFPHWNRLLFAPRLTAEQWTSLCSGTSPDFRPADVLPPEKDEFLALRDEENFFNIYRLFGRGSLPNTPLAAIPVSEFCLKGDIIASRGLVFARSGRAASQARIVTFDAREITPSSERILFPECAFFRDAGIRSLIETANAADRVVGTALNLLDALRGAMEIDPVFKAAVHLRLLALSRHRPFDWGLAFAPMALEHAAALEAISSNTEMGIRSSDWLLPGGNPRKADLARRLGDFYATTSRGSYLLQARVLRRLANMGVGDAGSAFAGFLDPSGTPRLHPRAPAALQLWGWPSSGDTPVLLFVRASAEAGWEPRAEAPVFSPLFAPAEDPAETLRGICDELRLGPQSPELAHHLPPIFTTNP